MKRFWFLVVLLACLPVWAQPVPQTEQFTLSNGLTLIVKPDRRAPTAVHMLWVRVGAMDEVGRGALGGPVTVGLVVVDGSVAEPVEGVRDSKLLTPAAMESFVPQVRAWALAHGVGHASAGEVDEWGIVGALRLAGHRALGAAALTGPVPDAVLLDVMMPKLSGLEVARRLRETNPRGTLPIVILSAKSRVEDIVAGFEAGADDYVQKPFAVSEMVARLEAKIDARLH